MPKVRFGSFPDAEYTPAERLHWGAWRPRIAIVPILAILSVCSYGKRPFVRRR